MPRLLPFLALLALAAPASADDLTPRQKGDLAIRARHILKAYCHGCHDGGAKNRGRFVALNHRNLVAKGPHPIPFVVPNDAAASQILHFIEDGSMPPGGRKRPTNEEVKVLREWIAAGAPGYPASYDDAFTAREMLDDINRQKPEDVPHLRYFSFAHLVRDNAVPDLQKAEDELNAALVSLDAPGPKERDVIAPVGDTATLYRFDIRTLGWDNGELFFRPAAKGTAPSVHDLTAYDLLLLEYPHAPAPDPQLGDYLAKAKLARPVPFLRGDWVSLALAKGSPLAEDLRSLTELSRALRAKGDPPLGQESGMPCGTRSRTVGGREPGASLAARYSGDITPSPPPFDLTVEVVDLDGNPLKSVTTGQPFRLRVNGKKGVRFVLVRAEPDGRVVVQPTNKNGQFDADDLLLGPTRDGPFTIGGIPTAEEKATEYFVLLAAELNADFPAPVIVQSRHNTVGCDDEKRFPVRRFLFDDKKLPKDFDPSRVVRRVIPVVVTEAK